MAVSSDQSPAQKHAYGYLTQPEVLFLDAAVARLIPADDLGPGVAASNYAEHMEKHNVPYRVEPVSILDIREGRVKVDAQGYPKHVPLGGKK